MAAIWCGPKTTCSLGMSLTINLHLMSFSLPLAHQQPLFSHNEESSQLLRQHQHHDGATGAGARLQAEH